MKKKIFYILLVMLSIGLFIPSVAAENFTCAAFGDEILIDKQLVDIVHTIIIIIQVVVPILLVIFGMIDLVKGVMAQKEDEIKKGQQTFTKRLIAAVVVFFVIAIVKLVMSIVAKDDDGIIACADCFLSGSGSESCEPAGSSSTPTPEP
jgi:hypothetical protein